MVKRQGRYRTFVAKMENKAKRASFLSGTVVAQRAQGNAPVDTGRLKRSIAASEPVNEGGNQVTYTGPVGLDSEIYPWVQELGSLSKSLRPEKSVDPNRPGGVTPKLYLTRALNESKQAVLTIHKKLFR